MVLSVLLINCSAAPMTALAREPAPGEFGALVYDPWLNGFPYRKSHVINAASGAGTNYQVKITVHYGAGTDSGADVYLNSHGRTDFGDVRFTGSDGVTQLSCWMEAYTSGDKATFWVKVTDDLSSTARTIYLYYGNSVVTTTSNGDNTFLFFDDFPGSSLDTTTKWTITYGTPLVENGYVKFQGVERIRSKSTFGTNTSLRIRHKIITSGSDIVWGMDSATPQQSIWFRDAPAVSEDVTRTYVTAWEIINVPAYDLTERIYDILRNSSTNVIFIKDGSTIATHTVRVPSESLYIVNSSDSSDEAWWDWCFIRKFISPEPAHGSWGSEDVLITQAGSAASWNWKVPAVDGTEKVRSGSATNWSWVTFQNDGTGITVPRGTATSWQWGP